jgi:lipopolysaccharide export system permease protein
VRIDLPGDPEVEEIQSIMPSAALVRSSDPKDVAELQWRLAMPVSVIVLLLLAVPLSKSSPRQGRYGRLVVAILLFVIYYNLLATAKYWVGVGKGPTSIGLWWVPVLPVLLTMLLLGSERIRCRFGGGG